MRNQGLAIGALARKTGCSADTIRFYERTGLMPPVPRTIGGHRLYEEDHVRRLAFIRRSRRLGMGLEQIRDVLAGIDRDDYSCTAMKALFTDCAVSARRQIEELQKIEANLCAMIDLCGDAGHVNCHAIEALLAGEDMPAAGRCCADASRTVRG